VKTLALETSGLGGGVAVLDGERILAHSRLAASPRTAQSLAPTIREVLHTAGWRPADVELVAVAIGPGSFTGLRLGVTSAKVFAYAVGAKLIGVDTLEVIASQATCEADEIRPVLPAERRQVFACWFRRDNHGSLIRLRPAEIVDIDRWLAGLQPGVAITGPALAQLADRLPAGVEVAAKTLWQPTATTVGRLAVERFKTGQSDDVWKLVPLYLRRSAAEEQRDRQSASRTTSEG